MSNFESIEFFFAGSKRHQILEPLKGPPSGQMRIEKQPTLPKAIPRQVETPPPKRVVEPAFKQEEAKKDSFYSEWEEKYKKLQASNLLAKEPFKRHALFVVEKADDSPFAKKICEAISTRIMKATYCIFKGSLTDLIHLHSPSHLILTFTAEDISNLPTVTISDLKGIESDPLKKKVLWETLKSSLTVG
jgi:hypothetical protein